MPDAFLAAQLQEIPNHGQLAVVVFDTPILLFRHDDEVFALDDVCTHTGDPLAGGDLDGYTVTCPWHGAQFDTRSGKNLRMPAVCPTRAHQVQVTNGDVFVTLRT